jgi:preprotein translocase subunit SecG
MEMLMILIILLIALIAVYLVLLHLSEIKDENKNFIPDEAEKQAGIFSKYVERVADATKRLYKTVLNKDV